MQYFIRDMLDAAGLIILGYSTCLFLLILGNVVTLKQLSGVYLDSEASLPMNRTVVTLIDYSVYWELET